jgi:hypothetical protein
LGIAISFQFTIQTALRATPSVTLEWNREMNENRGNGEAEYLSTFASFATFAVPKIETLASAENLSLLLGDCEFTSVHNPNCASSDALGYAGMEPRNERKFRKW